MAAAGGRGGGGGGGAPTMACQTTCANGAEEVCTVNGGGFGGGNNNAQGTCPTGMVCRAGNLGVRTCQMATPVPTMDAGTPVTGQRDAAAPGPRDAATGG
jgi:hypothetical protein